MVRWKGVGVWNMKMSGRAWTYILVTGAVAMVAAAIALGAVFLKGHYEGLVKRELVVNMTVEGCVSPDVYPPQFAGATLLGREGRDTWFTRDDDFLVYKSLPMPDISLREDPSARRIVSSQGEQVFISEFLTAQSSLEDDDGEPTDWIELHNREKISISLEGWSLTDTAKKPQKWVFPRYMLRPDQYLIVYASGKDRVSGKYIHTNFRLREGGEYIALTRPDGSVATALDKNYPPQMPNVAYGIPNYPTISMQFTFLNKPTPGRPNARVLNKGPVISKIKLQSGTDMPPAGEDLIFDVVVSPFGADLECVSFVYTVMYGNVTQIPMSRNRTSGGFTSKIPANEFSAGNMVRWYVKATDEKGRTVRDPPFPSSDSPEYYGTLILDSSLNSTLPSLHWFTKSPVEAVGDGASGSLFFNGKFYDNVFTRRRGASARTWRKPKIKFDFKGSAFEYKKNTFVEEFNLQSFFMEKGENSYMREPVALQIMRKAGIPASKTMYMTVNQNGEYYGLFALIEQIDDNFLVENGYSTDGPLFKAVDWMSSNLRYDIPARKLKKFFRKSNRKDVNDWHLLYDLGISLSGGGPMPRSKFIFDHLNLPEIINNMAVNTMVLNQDRCTKNYYLYINPVDVRWTIFPWDMDGAFGISHGFGGQPALDYCLLACEHFNSPLFCDSEHPQDVDLVPAGRRMTLLNVQEKPTYRFPSPKKYDKNQTGKPSLKGPAGHYNYLYDALLDWPVTREMYLRRLRTLVDEWTNGKVQDMFSELWSKIRLEVLKDNDKWKTSLNPDNGLRQLLIEQIPVRKAQLLDTYGPQGSGLVPSAQPKAPNMKVKNATEDYLEIENPNPFAVDMSNWLVEGDTNFKCPPGTVVASRNSVFITPDIKAFYKRKTSPTAGEGLFVIGPSMPIRGKSFIVQTDESVLVYES